MKPSSAATGGVAVVVGLLVLYLAVTGQLDKLDRAIRYGWNAAKGQWRPDNTTAPSSIRPTTSPAQAAFAWPLVSLS